MEQIEVDHVVKNDLSSANHLVPILCYRLMPVPWRCSNSDNSNFPECPNKNPNLCEYSELFLDEYICLLVKFTAVEVNKVPLL